MTTPASASVVSRRRAIQTTLLAALLLAFNYGTHVTTSVEAVQAVAVYLLVGYLTFTVLEALAARLWRSV